MSWPDVKLKDICELAVDCVNKTAPFVEYETPYKMLRTTNVRGGFVDVDKVRYVTEETYEKWTRRSVPQKGDVILTREAPLGDVGRLTSDDNVFLGQRLFQYRANPNKLDSLFLAYVLQSPLVQGRFKSRGFGATVQHAKVGDCENLEIPFPELSIQKKIGGILAEYDDLIENNRRRIQLLEESARLLYREWFVQLRFPGHEHVKIVDGVPEGWAHLTVGTLLGKIKRKGKVKKDDYKADGVLACVDQSKEFIGGYIDSTELAIVDELPILVFGDHTRVVKYIDFPFAPGADGTQLLIPKSNEIPRVFFYFLIAGINLANAFYARHFKFLKATEVLVPKKELMRLFEDSVSTNMNQISLLREQNKKLSKARDILLPRLMNGTLTV